MRLFACSIFFLAGLFVLNFANAQQGQWQHHMLSNGMRVAYCQDSTRKLAHIGLSQRGGTSLDSRGKDGLAALYEHLFFQYLPDSSQAKTAMRKGLLLSHATALETQFFGLSLPNAQMETGLKMLRMGLDANDWTEEQINEARESIAPTLQAQDDAPEHHLESEMLEELWQENAGRKRIPGKFTDISQLTAADIRNAISAYRHPGNCVLNASSALPVDDFFELAESALGEWEPISAGGRLPAFAYPKLKEPFYFTTVNEFASQPLIMMAWPVGDAEEAMPIRDVEARLFCKMAQLRQSEMYKHLVKSGLAATYSWSYAGGTQPGQLLLYVLPDPNRFQACLKAIQNLIPQLESDSILMRSDLNVALRQQALQRAMRDDQSIPRLMFEGESRLNDPDSIGAKSNPSVEDIRKFAGKYLIDRPYVAGLLANSATVFELGADTLFQAPIVAVAEPQPLPKVLQIDPAVLRSYRIYFDEKTEKPDSSANEYLAQVAEMLKSQPDKRLYLNGYAEGLGDGVVNYKLSILRAKNVREVLSKEFGVPIEQLVIRAYGEAFPEFPDDTAEHRRKNRRVTFDFAPIDAVDNAY